ncbi:hypothetical protein Vafri_9957 [Volvox africanus]|uniref:Guanylate cyclase domain-containing protein n=2 Tax=Volvox africanus TaxID=51714 RepID=A0A8J4B5I8_9CHLO|nr:hypothetical protein Vafri_9957 [Volvox africanus]
MGIFSCCLCGDKPGKEDAEEFKHKIQTEPPETQVQKEETPAVDGPPAPRTSTELSPAEEEQPLQLVAGRLAKHLLERQPSKSKKLQSASSGGAVGQRWVSSLDGPTVDGPAYNGNTATGGLLLQEVKPLYDPVAGASTSRLGGTYGSLTSQANTPHNGTSGHQSGSMNFARSVNRLSAINTSGAFSRRASLLDLDFTKASLQLALGSSILRGSIAGGVSTHSAPPEPWMLQHILRQMSLAPPPAAAAAHPAPYLLPSGPLGGHTGFMPSSLPATASVMAAIAAGLGQNPSNAGRPSCDRDNSRSSYGQIHPHSPAATHGQHVLHPQHSAYPVPLFSRAVCERVENLPAPLVVLVLRSAAAAAGASDGGRLSGLGTGASPGLGHGEEVERSEAVGRNAASTGCSNLDIGDECDGGVSWPVQTPGVPVVTSMKLDMPALQQIEGKRHIFHASHTSRIVSGRQPSNPSQASHPGDADAEARQRAYACLVSALEEAAGRHVALVHAWHNAAAGALLTTAATIAAATATTGGIPTGGSDSQESQCNVSDGGVAALAAGALAEGGEVGVVLWGLRELFDQDPCLPLLARDLLRQAAIRPEHVPPLTHSLVPSAYSSLLAGRDPFSAAAMAVAGPTTAGTGIPGGGVGHRRIILGSTALQAAVNMGQVRVHVCVFQTAPADKAASVMSMVDTMVSAGSAAASAPQAAWLPAVVLEWPQPVASTPPMPVPPPPIALGASSAFNATALLSPMARASVANSQHRSVFHDVDRPQSSSFMTLEGPGPTGAVGLISSGAAAFPRQVPVDMPVPGSQLILPNVMPSLSLGMASISSTVAPVAVEPGPATANVIGSAFGSPASAAAMEEPTALAGGELAPLAGAELLYVIQTWQRHHLLLASVPYAITLFDCGGRVLQQNQGSVDFMGEITGDPMEQHQSIAAAAGAAAGGSAGLEQRTSATRGAKAAGAHAPGKSGLGSGSGGGSSVGFAGGTPLMEISEVDVLSVLFCLCPDLLDEMLEEVICGNMWRGIVQVPRVMRPCIRAAQRWGAMGKAAVAQGSSVAAAVATAAGGITSCLAGGGASGAPDIRRNSGAVAFGVTVKQPCASESTPMEMNTEPPAGPPASHNPPGLPRNSHSGSSDLMEPDAAPNLMCIGAGANELVQHARSFNSGRPSMNVGSPLRRLATSLAVSGAAMDLKGPGRLRGSSGGEGNGADASGSGQTGPKRLGPSRRPPARSYSLRGLIRPMVSSFSNQYASSSLRGGSLHRLALGDGNSGASAASTEQLAAAVRAPEAAATRTLAAAGTRALEATATQVAKAEDAKVPEAATVSPPARLPRRRPPTRVCESSSLGEPHFHSFTAGQARGLPPRQASEHMLMTGAQQQGTQGQQQSLNRGTLTMSPSFGAVGKPRSSVLAFAERLRSGRLPGVSSGDSSNSTSASGTLPARSAPRRLRSGLSLASGPDGPLPGSQGSPFTTHLGTDFAVHTAEVEQSEISAATTGEQMKGDPQAGAATTPGTEAGLAVLVAATPGAVTAQPAAKSDGVAGHADFPCASDSSQTAWEPESDGQVVREAELRSLRSGSGMDVWMGHSPIRGSATSHAADFTTSPPGCCGSGGNDRDERGRLTPPQLGRAGDTQSPSLLSLADQRQIRMMSDPVAHPVLPQATVISDPRNYGTANPAADYPAPGSLSAIREATASPPKFKTAGVAELMASDGHAVHAANGASLLNEVRPAHSVPIKPLEADVACSAEDVVHSEYPAEVPPQAWGARNYSANGAALQPGSGGHHARGSVRRQLHALKRPLSRSSTRTYLMTAIPTSTLNVLGRVHSMRQMEYEEQPDSERDVTLSGQQDRIGGGGSLVRASTTNAAMGRRKHTAAVYRSKSQSLNVTATEPRMAVPRIFSFMRSASKRMLQQMQGQQVDAISCRSTGGDACSTTPITISPQRRHTFELTPLNANGVSGSDTAGGGGGLHRLSHSPRWSADFHPQRLSPVVSPVGLETAYEDASIEPSGSNSAPMGEAPPRHFSITSEGPLHKSSREQVTSSPRPLPASAIMGDAMPSSSSEGEGSGPVAAAAATATASPSSVAGVERVSRGSAQPPMPPQLTRLRASEDWADAGGVGIRMMSPREMSPADMARRVGMAWHEVAATSFTDPVTGARVVALVQNDVSEKVETEMQLTELMEVEHRLLEQIFPRHVLEHIAMQNISGAAVQHNQAAGAGRKQRRMSQFDLLKSQDCSQLAHHHEQITVLFCDVKGFTAMCSSVEPAVVMSFLNMLYTQFDSLLHVHDVYKVETIGDCYMVAGGLVRRGSDGVAALLEFGEVDLEHARKVVNFAKDLLDVVREMHMPNGQPLQVRVGIHSGPAMSGVVGTKMPRFCLFGDTINTASRCESTCPPSAIHATTAVRDLVPEEPWVATGGVMAKGKGMMRTFLLGPNNPAATPPESADDGAVSDLCSSRPVGAGIGMGSGFLSPPTPPMHGTGVMAAAAAAATGIVTASGAGPDISVAPIAAAAFAPAAPTSPAAASRHSALRRLGSGVRRNNSLRAITTTSAAVAAAAAAAAASGGTGGLPNSVTLMPPGSIAAAAIAAAGGGGLGSSGPASPNGRMASGAAVSSSAPPVVIATNSGYLRLPSTVLSSSPAETATTNTLVRTFAPAGELPCISPVVDPSRTVTAAAAAADAGASTATAIDPDVDCLPSAHDVRVVNIMTAGQRLGGDVATGPRVGVVGVGMSPQPHVTSQSLRGVSLFAAQTTRTELGTDFVSSSAVVPPSGLLFDSGIGVTATEPVMQAGALPSIVYEVQNEHEPQDLGENLRAPLGSRAGGGGGGSNSASASR